MCDISAQHRHTSHTRRGCPSPLLTALRLPRRRLPPRPPPARIVYRGKRRLLRGAGERSVFGDRDDGGPPIRPNITVCYYPFIRDLINYGMRLRAANPRAYSARRHGRRVLIAPTASRRRAGAARHRHAHHTPSTFHPTETFKHFGLHNL